MKAMLFDLDNTLMDFMSMKKTASDAAVEALIQNGLKMSKEEAMEKLYELYWEHGIENQQILQTFLEKHHGNAEPRMLAAAIVAYRKAKATMVKTYPGVKDTLRQLKQRGLKLAIVSDAPRLQVWTRLTELDIQHYFDVVVTHDDTGHHKPSPAPFEMALEALNVAPEEVMHVGDWPDRDIKGAKALGMKTALAKYGLTKEVTIEADYTLNAINELLLIPHN